MNVGGTDAPVRLTSTTGRTSLFVRPLRIAVTTLDIVFHLLDQGRIAGSSTGWSDSIHRLAAWASRASVGTIPTH
jgi:hypothetical protein